MRDYIWNIVGNFKFNNEMYILVINDKCKRFYFKQNGNDYDYLSIDEYLKISKEFNRLKIIKGSKCNIIEKLPLIKIKNKLVSHAILMTLIFSLTGCNNIKNANDTIKILEKDGVHVECFSQDNDIYSIESVTFENMKDNTSCGVSFEGYYETPFEKICTPYEFESYINVANLTWNDVKNAINNNQNIDQQIKDILTYGVNNLENAEFNMNKALIYFNISNLSIEYKEADELQGNAGYFDHLTKTAYISFDVKNNLDFYKEVLIHEILGHGMTRGYIQSNGWIMCDLMTPYLIIEENGTINSTGDCGYFAMEGIADIITSLAMSKKLDYDNGAYTPEVYYLSTLCSSVGITVEEYADHGIEYLIQKMKENGIENPYYLISVLDNQTLILNMYGDLQVNNTELFMDYFNELIEKGNTEYIQGSTTEYLNYITTENVDGVDVVIRMKNDNSFAIIQPEEINNLINSVFEYNK